MAREKKVFDGYDLANIVANANDYLRVHRGWDVIQLTYGQFNNHYTIAFTAVDKKAAYTREFSITEYFESIIGSKQVGIFYTGLLNTFPTRWFVGVDS